MEEKRYTWDAIAADLRRIDQSNPNFLPNMVLVGGAACWYFRRALGHANDSDFKLPNYTLEDERVWVSRDLDFMGDSDEEISLLLGRPCPPMGTLIEYAGATLDFIDEGLSMTRREANRTARRAELPGLTFYIASPGLLYAEKLICTLRKTRPQDPLHKDVLARFLKMELSQTLERAAELDPKAWLNDAKELKTSDFQFFSNDPVLARRLRAAATRLPSEFRAIVHWIRHQVPI